MTSIRVSFPVRYRDRKGRTKWSVAEGDLPAPDDAPLAMTYREQVGAFRATGEHVYRLHGGRLYGIAAGGQGNMRDSEFSLDRVWPEEVREDPSRWRDVLFDADRWRELMCFRGPRWDSQARDYVNGHSRTDQAEHPFMVKGGRPPTSRDDFVDDPGDDPGFAEMSRRARFIVAGAMAHDGVIWLPEQGPVVTCIVASVKDPTLHWFRPRARLDGDSQGVVQQALAFPVTDDPEDIRRTISGITGRRVTIDYTRNVTQVIGDPRYDTRTLDRVVEAAVLYAMWEARKLAMKDADRGLVEALLATRETMRDRYPGAAFDLGVSDISTWVEARIGRPFPEAGHLLPALDRMTAALEGRIGNSGHALLRMAASRAANAPLPATAPSRDDDTALDDVARGFGF